MMYKANQANAAAAAGVASASKMMPWHAAGLADRPLWAGYSGQGTNFMTTIFGRCGARLRQYSNGQDYGITSQGLSNGEYYGSVSCLKSSSSQVSSNSPSPHSGHFGVCQFDGHINAVGVQVLENGYSDRQQYSHVNSAMAYQGIVVGESPAYRQGMYLGLRSVNVYCAPLNMAQRNEISGHGGFSLSTDITGLVSGTHYTTNTNYGMIGYNRKANVLVLLSYVTTHQKIWLRLRLGEKNARLGLNRAANIKLVQDAVDNNNGASMEFGGFSHSLTSDAEANYGHRVVVCADGTFWTCAKAPNNKIELARVYDNNGTPTFEVVHHLSTTTSYGLEQATAYRRGVVHQVSESCNMVALSTIHYYHCAGMHTFFVPTDTAQEKTRYSVFSDADTTYNNTIAPSGGDNFVIVNSENHDGGVGAKGGYTELSLDKLTGGTQSITTLSHLFDTYSESTAYTGWAAIPIMPINGTEMMESWGANYA